MPRQSISLTPPNDEWLKLQLAQEEYSSKSELVNDLIRRARQEQEHVQYIRARLVDAERSGPCNQTGEELLSEFKAEAEKNGQL